MREVFVHIHPEPPPPQPDPPPPQKKKSKKKIFFLLNFHKNFTSLFTSTMTPPPPPHPTRPPFSATCISFFNELPFVFMRGGTIHDRTSFVILCNASTKRNGQWTTTHTLLYAYTDIFFRWKSKDLLTHDASINNIHADQLSNARRELEKSTI